MAERIGYAATAGPWLDLARHDSVDRVVRLAVEPIGLESIQVQADRKCTGDPRATATARVWDEARKALTANRLTRGAAILRYGVLEFRRTLDAGGYVRQAPRGQFDYFAPDAAVLLSSSFLDTHCFRLQDAPPGEPGLIGLAFQPRQDRHLPDVDGVFWLENRRQAARSSGAVPWREGTQRSAVPPQPPGPQAWITRFSFRPMARLNLCAAPG